MSVSLNKWNLYGKQENVIFELSSFPLFFIITFHRKKNHHHIGTKREQVIHRSVHKHTITRGGGFEIQAGDVAFIN